MSLFQTLIGDTAWASLPEAVRTMHGGDARVIARGHSHVDGDARRPAQWTRRIFGLPEPGTLATMAFTLERRGACEYWTRHFTSRPMHSVLDASPRYRGWLRERLGPATLHFELLVAHGAIDWKLRAMHVFGIRLPQAWLAGVAARSSAEDGRYRFDTSARLPGIGLLVAYRGHLDHDE
jgi:hypothetical protein